MKTLITTKQIGHFNFCDSSQESCEVHFRVVEKQEDGKEQKIINASISFRDKDDYPDIERYMDPEDAIYLMEEWDKKMFISTRRTEVRALVDYLKENLAEIQRGNLEETLKDLKKKREGIDRDIAEVEEKLSL